MKEVWKDIKGYEGLYQVSNLGRIKSLYNYRGKNHILKPRLKCNYYQIGLRKNNKRKWHIVHRIVAEAFINNPNNLLQVNHKDENKLNNCVENLEWCSALYNNTYGSRIERVKSKTSKPVYQYDLKGNFIKKFKSVSEAGRELKISIGNISECANNKKASVNKFIFSFEGGDVK